MIDRVKYVEDIRRIVKVDVNQKALGPANRKASIDARKGIAYNSAQVGSPGGARGSSSTLGTTLGNDWFDDGSLEEDIGSGSNDEADGEEKGNSTDPKNPTKSIVEYDQGTHDIEDIIDDAPGTPYPSDTVPQGLQQTMLKNGGTLNGVTGAMDCDSGKELDIRMDKLLRPPAGWDTLQDPGDVSGPNGYYKWEAGRSWFGSSISQPEGYDAITAAKAARDESGDGDKTTVLSATFDGDFPHTGGVFRWIFEFQNPGTMAVASYYAADHSCTPVSGDPICPFTNPTRWPADGKMQIVLNTDGTYKAAELEAPEDIIPKYTDNLHSRINFCFGDGRFGSIIPAINGGYIITETLTEGGTATGLGKLFNSQNKVIAYVSELTIPKYLPR